MKFHLTLNNILQEKDHTKYLGVIIDNNLTWKNHITQIKLRLSKGIGILYKLRQVVSQSVLRSLYFAFVQSNINYCLLNWGNAAPINLTQIKTSLNKALRVMCFKDPRYHAHTLYKELKILPFEETYKQQLAKFMWTVKQNILP